MRKFLLAGLLPAAAVCSQYDYAFDRSTPGVLGQPLTFAFSGAPAGTALLFMLSSNSGPFPLSIVSPGDTRALEVGIELASVWFPVGTGAGSGSVAIPTPNNPSLHALTLQFQTLTLPGATFLVDKLSNPVAAQLGETGRGALLAATLVTPRGLAGTTQQDSNGEILLAGGGGGSILAPIGLDTSEVFDVRRLTVRAGPRLTTARALGVTVTLSDGRTLLCGGVDALGNVLNSAELYDPAQRAFVATGSMASPRCLHAGTRLADGRVLVMGGTTTLTDAVAALTNAQATAEVYNPATGTWSSVPSAAKRLLAPGLDALSNGRALLSGGFEVAVVFGIPIPIGSVSACQSFNPTTNTWASAAAMRASRAMHDATAMTLPSGDLLVTGGATSGPDLTLATSINKAETYNPATNAWTALPDMYQACLGHSLALLGGRALVAGGAQGTLAAAISIDTVQALDLGTRTWSLLPNLTGPRGGQGTGVTADGLLIMLGGQGATNSLSSVETIR